MEIINIKATDETPEVTLNAANHTFLIAGRSLPEDVTAFYDPIVSWLSVYIQEPNDITEFVFRMDYFNTASSKMILDVILKLEHLVESGHNAVVKWCYREDDEDMEEAGEEYADIVEVPFRMIPIEV